MFCKKCGEEINDEAVICPKCGCETGFKKDEPDEPKTGIGILLGLFLGIIGLIIGLCLYKEGTVARKTFLKAWGITFAITVIAIIIIYSIILNNINNELEDLYSDIYNDYYPYY